MDKSWMSSNRLSKDYSEGVELFLNFAESNASNINYIPCPCIQCGNLKKLNRNQIKDHLFIHGINMNYKTWSWHGEIAHEETLQPVEKQEAIYDNLEDNPIDMVNDVGAEEHFVNHPQEFEKLLNDAKEPIYPGSKFTKLSTLVRLYNFKARHGLSDQGFNDLLDILKCILPEENVLPKSTNEAKKTLRSLGMGYEKIHACPNDCILYRKENADISECPVCHISRWKTDQNSKKEKKGVPAKVLWYIPPIPRFKRLFQNPDHAKSLRWHHDERIVDGKLRHPADSEAWKVVDETWPQIKEDPRNLRLGLSADGINPYRNLSSTYSCWPVILVIYNLPPWLCFKRRFMMLTLLISGPKQPGNDIDVYLQPLIDDLKLLWSGVDCFDGHTNESFKLRGLLLWTINDFPAYGNLSGSVVRGYYACPICGEDTHSTRLQNGKKQCFMGHRRFLKEDHHYRKYRKTFDGKKELQKAPLPLSGEDVYEKVSKLSNRFGKVSENRKDKRKVEDSSEIVETKKLWKKKSIFFELEYWKFLVLRHNLDVMHIEKNVCDSIIGTLFNIPGKTKDGLNARLDLQEMGVRKELAPEYHGDRIRLPSACFSLTKQEKQRICQTLASVKVPEGYSSNIRNLVSMKDFKLTGLKSHDCHALMQQLLPVALNSVLVKEVRYAIMRVCFFFNAICTRVVDISKLNQLQDDIVITLCLLEMYFPPSFFDIMVHLTVHLVRETQLCGPVHLRWMYPFERYMKVLKGFVRNQSRPEACIVESYIAEEAIEFCLKYISDADAIGIPTPRYDPQSDGKGISTSRVEKIEDEHDWELAHQTVLENTTEVIPYINEHLEWLKIENPTKTQKWIQDEHHKMLRFWFKKKVEKQTANCIKNVSSTLRWISEGPTHLAIKHEGYVINGRRFNTKKLDDARVNQNSGVCVVAKIMQFASGKDKNPIYSDMTFYGVIKEIWELDYHSFRIPIFKCDWVNNTNGTKEEAGMTLVDLNMIGYTNDPFIMATQAKQVFYVSDIESTWSFVLSTQPRYIAHNNDRDDDTLEEHKTFDKEFRDVHEFDDLEVSSGSYVRDDGEDEWIKCGKGKKRKRKFMK